MVLDKGTPMTAKVAIAGFVIAVNRDCLQRMVHIKLDRAWTYSLFKRMGSVQRKPTTSESKITCWLQNTKERSTSHSSSNGGDSSCTNTELGSDSWDRVLVCPITIIDYGQKGNEKRGDGGTEWKTTNFSCFVWKPWEWLSSYLQLVCKGKTNCYHHNQPTHQGQAICSYHTSLSSGWKCTRTQHMCKRITENNGSMKCSVLQGTFDQ